MNPGKLRRCPDCGGPWPKGPQYELQGTDWLHDLGRGVSQSNFDVLIHDGAHRDKGDRFLNFELKGPTHPLDEEAETKDWPLQSGQQWLLEALARQQGWVVAVLRGTTRRTLYYRVQPTGVSKSPIATYAEAIRRSVRRWLAGGTWRDAEEALAKEGPLDAPVDHTCGWARVDGVWRCIQDHFAIGYAPHTSCGATTLLPSDIQP